MQTGRENGMVYARKDSLRFRARARRTAMSEDEFGPQETEEHDLDTARITGQENPETYRIERFGDEKGPIDYRDVDPIHD